MRSRWIALSALVLAVMLIAVDATVLSLAVPFLAQGPEPRRRWNCCGSVTLYSFVLAGLLVTNGHPVATRIGRKRLLLIGAAPRSASVVAAYARRPVR